LERTLFGRTRPSRFFQSKTEEAAPKSYNGEEKHNRKQEEEEECYHQPNRSPTNSFFPNPNNPQEKNTKTTIIIKMRPNSATAAVRL
jgi:hypothetical protein